MRGYRCIRTSFYTYGLGHSVSLCHPAEAHDGIFSLNPVRPDHTVPKVSFLFLILGAAAAAEPKKPEREQGTQDHSRNQRGGRGLVLLP